MPSLAGTSPAWLLGIIGHSLCVEARRSVTVLGSPAREKLEDEAAGCQACWHEHAGQKRLGWHGSSCRPAPRVWPRPSWEGIGQLSWAGTGPQGNRGAGRGLWGWRPFVPQVSLWGLQPPLGPEERRHSRGSGSPGSPGRVPPHVHPAWPLGAWALPTDTINFSNFQKDVRPPSQVPFKTRRLLVETF